QALVGEGAGEERLFSSKSNSSRDGIGNDIDLYHKKIKEQYGVSFLPSDVGISPRVHRFQVIDALVSLCCRSNISAEILWDGGWLLRQLLPYSEAEFNSHHLELLKVSYKNYASDLVEEVRGIWSDFLIPVLSDEWRKCKRAMESSSPQKEPNCILLLPRKFSSEGAIPEGSSFAAGERMHELVKVFVLLHQLQIFTLGRTLSEQPPIYPSGDLPANCRARGSGLDVSGPKAGTEISLGNAVPCRIAFERGKAHHFCFVAISFGISGWLVLAEELPLKKSYGVVRAVAPLAGCNPRIDDKHATWLHLRIRSSSLPFLDPAQFKDWGKIKTKASVDGRWTLAFRDEEICRSAFLMIVEEIKFLTDEVHRRLKPFLNLETAMDLSISSEDSASYRTHPSDAVRSSVSSEKRRSYFGEIILYILCDPKELPHGPDPGWARIPPRIGGYDLQLFGIPNGLSNHFVIRHGRPRVGQTEQETRRGEYQTRPRVGFRSEVHEHGGQAPHGLAEEEGGEVRVGLAATDVEEERERGACDFLHVAEVAPEAVGAAVAEEVGGEDSIAPVGEVDADFLEEPAGVGAVAVGHKDGGFDVVVEREERLSEDFAVGGVEYSSSGMWPQKLGGASDSGAIAMESEGE
ncbi:hypothetical protein CR513_55478, partial [Mucuna pruriens]